jgi:hypothetical protein
MNWMLAFGVAFTLAAASTNVAAQVAPPGAAPVRSDPSAGVAAADPAPPVEPAVISRDQSGRAATIRAVRLTGAIQLDGHLDEEMYTTVPSISGFIQQEPSEGAPATEQTEVWVFFDDEHIYVVGRCWDSQPERMIANEMRRDGQRVPRNENFAFSFDSFHDRRNGYNFEVTPVGGRLDTEIIADGAVSNRDWNPVWEVAAARFDKGWALEARIPFKSLRYHPGQDQTWGFQVRRMVRWKNEISYINWIPASVGERGHQRVSLSPTLVGIAVPPPGLNLELKPYAISTLATDTTVTPRISNDLSRNWGGDIKYGISKSFTADFTYNTDFAQVEADQQQVNLTRFSLFFPEKRDFFLENAGVFTFGGANGSDNTPALFYSRRIGLAGSQAVPIVAGGRLTGRVGKLSVGVLNIQSDRFEPSALAPIPTTNFSVMRVRRDVLRRSSVGAIFTRRSVDQNGGGANGVFGVDGTFALSNTLVVNTFLARSSSQGRRGDDTSYHAQVDYAGDRYGLLVDQLGIGVNFNPELGFVRHPNMRRSFGSARFSPRPRQKNRIVRKYYYMGSIEYIENDAGRVDTRAATGEFAIDFQNSDKFNVRYTDTHEFLPVRLLLATGVVVPVGAYDYANLLVGYNTGPQKTITPGNFAFEHGSFYGGRKDTLTVGNSLVSFPPHLMIEPTYTLNHVTLPQAEFTSHLIGPRVTYTATPLMFWSALLQYNSTAHAFSANVRWRWEYRPGSELFVVWNESRDTGVARFAGDLANRALIVKINRLLRF